MRKHKSEQMKSTQSPKPDVLAMRRERMQCIYHVTQTLLHQKFEAVELHGIRKGSMEFIS